MGAPLALHRGRRRTSRARTGRRRPRHSVPASSNGTGGASRTASRSLYVASNLGGSARFVRGPCAPMAAQARTPSRSHVAQGNLRAGERADSRKHRPEPSRMRLDAKFEKAERESGAQPGILGTRATPHRRCLGTHHSYPIFVGSGGEPLRHARDFPAEDAMTIPIRGTPTLAMPRRMCSRPVWISLYDVGSA
jgi:hypothetical protein